MKNLRLLLAVILIMATLGCAGMSTREQRALSGGAIGAGTGAAAGALAGEAGTGAVIGGALGAGGGYFYEDIKDQF